jgi:GT2 family glycosyltransferase/2-polyprenyl-3-methyl-5-hydroxy-6-metoxy-1,4-benzoquinol methylase
MLMLELDKYGYTRDDNTGVWVRADFQGIAYSDGDQAENTLANIIREAKDVSVLSPELPQHCTDWAKLYHLSPSRGNLFRPFESLLKGKSVLEIGAGCGAISRYLGEAGAEVLSLEGSPRRASIAASRVRGLDNVTVLAERFDDFKVEQQFDVITLIGVLEYASMFSADPEPAYGMLKRIRQLLKPDGHLFIAIENQLGLKYFAGAPEDHMGIAMYGIEGRYSHGQPKTFGKIELQALISRADFNSADFLSPYPDYKLPNSLITENGFSCADFDAAALAWQNTRKDPQIPARTHFNLEKAWPVVIDNQLGMDLANSFLVVTSPSKESTIPQDVLAYHYSTGRRAEYCKEAVFVQTTNGIEVLSAKLANADSIETAGNATDGGFRHTLSQRQEYANGKVLSADFLNASLSENWTVESFTPFLMLYLESLRQLLQLEGSATDLDRVGRVLPGRYLDAVPQNVVLTDKGFPHLIDIEWEKTGGVELGHLLMRGLLLLIAGATPFSASATVINRRDFIIKLLGTVSLVVTELDLDRYAEAEADFQELVTGRNAKTFLNWAPEATIPVSGTANDDEPTVATLYFRDQDGDFSESHSVSQQARNGEQTLVFNLPANLRSNDFRFDPVNKCQPFTIRTLKLCSGKDVVWTWQDGNDAPLQAVGAVTIARHGRSSVSIATSDDPCLIIPFDSAAHIGHSQLSFQVTFVLLTEQDVAQRMHLIEGEIEHHLENSRSQLVEKDTHIHNLNLHIMAMYSSTSWKVSAPVRYLSRFIRRSKLAYGLARSIIRRGGGLSSTAKKVFAVWQAQGVAGVVARARWAKGATNDAFIGKETREVIDRHDYQKWVQYYDTLSETSIQTLTEEVSSWDKNPVISIIMPVYNPPLDLLREAVESVKDQIYPHWQLCLADDASTDPEVVSYLTSLEAQDKRIKVTFRTENGHISHASNSALSIATGQFVALMDNDDLLPAHALYWVARTIRENPDAGVIYSDEDKIDTKGVRSAPYFKSDWNEFLFRSQNMICHLGVYRRDLVDEVGQFRAGFEGAQDYDLALRCIDKLERSQIIHIPRVLYHWRIHAGSTAMAGDEKPYAALAGVKALDEHLKRKGDIGTTELLPMGMYRVHYKLPESLPLVTLVIPTRNAHALVRQCIDSIKSLTTYPRYEIILVDNGSDEPESLEYFAALGHEENIRVMRDDGPFNYSALNNKAVKLANGELIGLINNDIEVVTPGWLEEMVSIALQPKVGAVGARLWYPDDRLQHGGVVVGVGGVAGHSHKYLPKGDYGYFCRAALTQEFSAVTAACLIIKKSIFEEVHGLDEVNLKIAFNDVDFCLRVQEAGYLNVWTPFAELYHHESATRGLEDTPQKKERFSKEVLYVQSRWPALRDDYTYNPNLTLDHEDFGLAWPPRVKN